MIWQVIEGRYQGGAVHRHPEKNVLFIQTQDGSRIALSKQNVISIENVSDQYPDIQGRVLMVIWNDFETSVLRLGVGGTGTKSFSESKTKSIEQDTHKARNATSKRKKKKSILIPLLGGIGFVLIVVIAALFLIPKKHEHRWIPATCVTPEKCENCDETRGDVLGHVQGEQKDSMISCARCGEIIEYLASPENNEDIAEIPATTVPVEVVTEPSVATAPPTENLTDLLDIEKVKWHKHYLNADHYHCDLIVTNNSQQLVDAEFSIKYFDASGNVIGVSSVSTEALGPGASHLLTSKNESPYEYAEVSITSAKVDDRYKGSMENVSCTDYVVNDKKVIFEVSNNGNAAVEFVSAYVLFYNGDEVVDYDYAYAIDDDNELKPGASLMAELSTNKSFTNYRIFYYGRID